MDVVKTVKTGDTAQIGLFAILSIAAIVVVIIVLRRRKNL
ncbi:sortase B protein-sorting domain-containing protein [Dorea formicigenerans]|nr:sortase B protein-sorting domain-containing protein [Dorea formicigenerans]MCB6381174.1 sortase B protein-sorting domain-containing protein [Dorea formicigenerans]MCB6389359.1 sortase B protein-sorting domain-containing protein [Dorea formicigenerans]MCB6395216.1 sortase B protein-sorting domain-containing protein [Dorea formicigenerans]MCB6409882.1 sortase B protein-sorting domain-containing protein [Dorea formicigenerans]MCB6467361.1 sortase B protein-sorting domain-containing protein [Do